MNHNKFDNVLRCKWSFEQFIPWLCSGRSWFTQPLNHYDWVLKQILDRSDIRAISLQFAKAFNKIDHSVIYLKLWDFSIACKQHNVYEYTCHVVAANEFFSVETPIHSVVPYSTGLWQLLFLMTLLHLPTIALWATITNYTYDTKLTPAITDVLAEGIFKFPDKWAKFINSDWNYLIENNLMKYYLFSSHFWNLKSTDQNVTLTHFYKTRDKYAGKVYN